MSRVPRWGHGSKRRLRLIRWSWSQIAGAVVLAFVLMLLGYFLAQWLAAMEMDERQEQMSLRGYTDAHSGHGMIGKARRY